MTDKKRYEHMSHSEQDKFVADVIDFFEDDGSMNGKLTKHLIEGLPYYDERDLKVVRKALVVSRLVFQNHPGRDALYVARKPGLVVSRLLRERSTS
jgi:hypothetical protein